MWPLAKKLTRFLEKRFITREELEGKPKYLDKNVLSIPSVAVDAIFKELINVNQHIVNAGSALLSQESFDTGAVEKDHAIVLSLTTEISNYISLLNKNDLPNEVATSLPDIMLVTQKYVSFMELAKDAVDLQKKIHFKEDVPEILEAINQLKKLSVNTLEATAFEKNYQETPDLDKALEVIDDAYEDLKFKVFKTGTRGKLGIVSIDAIVHQASLIKRMVKIAVKAKKRMLEVAGRLDIFKTETNIATAEEQKAA